MATGNLELKANVSGGPDGARTFGPLTVLAPTAAVWSQAFALASGDNTIVVPAGITACLIIPPNAAVPTPNPPFGGTITYRVTGGTGTADTISSKWPRLMTWDTPPASFVLNASGTCTVIVWGM